jgi:hypothetical protein
MPCKQARDAATAADAKLGKNPLDMGADGRNLDLLARIFGLLSEDLSERDVREAVGHHLLELLEADHYASFVWQDATGRFEKAVYLNMDPDNIAAYDRYYQQHDPITSKLQARREATLVTQVMPQRDLMRTEFFNDFLARDGLHWGVNAYSFVDGRNIGDVRIWRGRRRENFDGHTLELLRLIEPAFTGALALPQNFPKAEGSIWCMPRVNSSTATVELKAGSLLRAGTSCAELAAALAEAGQECPLDPRDPAATVAGTLAAGLSGLRRLGDFLIFVAVHDAGRHDLSNAIGPRIATFGDRADRDVPIGDHPGQPVVLTADRQCADAEVLHLAGRIGHGAVDAVGEEGGVHDLRVVHDVLLLTMGAEATRERSGGLVQEVNLPSTETELGRGRARA